MLTFIFHDFSVQAVVFPEAFLTADQSESCIQLNEEQVQSWLCKLIPAM